MRDVFIVIFGRLFVVALFVLTLNIQPVPAQEGAYGPYIYTGNYTTDYARYYAPYALQAAGAYLSVGTLDKTLKLEQGEDVRRVVEYAIQEPDPVVRADLIGKAKNYLRAWRYQFGSEKYLKCFEDDPDCLKGKRRGKLRLAEGPAFHVWARTGYPDRTVCSEVSIAFRGSDNVTWSRWRTDWATNADTFLGWATDNSYRQLARNTDAILKKIATLPCYRTALIRPQIVSVGHSLGAGLGQLAALAHSPENKAQGLFITKVFAFDASPLTGSSYVADASRNEIINVDLIYQSGEALAYLRGDVIALCRRSMGFSALHKAGPKGLHNMSALSREIVRMSYHPITGKQRDFAVPSALPGCVGYTAPATDVDPDLPPAPQAPLMSGPGAPVTRTTAVNRGRAMNSFAMSGEVGFASAPVTEMVGSVAPATAKLADAPRSKKAGRAQAPALQVSFEAAWPPG